MSCSEVFASFHELRIVDLPPIVCDNSLGQAEVVDNGLSNEVTSLSFGDAS